MRSPSPGTQAHLRNALRRTTSLRCQRRIGSADDSATLLQPQRKTATAGRAGDVPARRDTVGVPATIRPGSDSRATLAALERLYDEQVATVFGQALAAVCDSAEAEAVVEDAFRRMARLLPRLSRSADASTVLGLAMQQAIAARCAVSAGRPAPTAASAFAAWRMAERGLAQAAVGTRPTAERAYIRAWIAYQDAVDGGVAIIVADDNGRYEAVNEAACGLFGRGCAALLALGVEQVTDPEVAHGVREVWQRFLAAGEMAGTYEIARSDGELCLVDFRALANTPLPGHHVSRLTRSADHRTLHGGARPLVQESEGPRSVRIPSPRAAAPDTRWPPTAALAPHTSQKQAWLR